MIDTIKYELKQNVSSKTITYWSGEIDNSQLTVTISLGTKTSMRSFLNMDFSKLAAVFGLGMSSKLGFYSREMVNCT